MATKSAGSALRVYSFLKCIEILQFQDYVRSRMIPTSRAKNSKLPALNVIHHSTNLSSRAGCCEDLQYTDVPIPAANFATFMLESFLFALQDMAIQLIHLIPYPFNWMIFPFRKFQPIHETPPLTNDFSSPQHLLLSASPCAGSAKRPKLLAASEASPVEGIKRYWLVVSTHLKNISQNGSFRQVGTKITSLFETTT